MTQIEHEAGAAPDTSMANILYVMHGISPFTLWSLSVVAVIIGAVTRDKVRGTWVESHYSWLARTFFWGLLWFAILWVITAILIATIIGIVLAWVPWVIIFPILFIWYMYRVIRGWLLLNDRKPAPV